MVIELDPYAEKLRECVVEGCIKQPYGRGMCKAHHQWHWKRGLLPARVDRSARHQLERRTIPVTESGCLLWVGPVNNNGYGVLKQDGELYAHRLAYRLAKGGIGKGLSVCHRCDTPSCVNPDHLFLATHRENMQDSARKGRAKQPNIGSGFDHPRACLFQEDVAALRSGAASAADIAARRGCHPETARRARDGITYTA